MIEVVKMKNMHRRAVMAIDVASYDPPWSHATWKVVQRQPSMRGMVALVSTTPVGFIIFDIGRHAIEIVRIGVLPTERRMSVGTTLLAAAMPLATENHREVTCAIGTHEAIADSFLRYNGFRASGFIRQFCGSKHDAVVLSRNLTRTTADGS